MNIEMNFEALVDKLINTVSTRTVVGEPLEFGNITLIPVMNAYFGFGGGSGTGGSGQADHGSGSGGGGGARLKVAGMVVIKDGSVSFLPAGKESSVDKLLDAIPDLMEKVKAKTEQ